MLKVPRWVSADPNCSWVMLSSGMSWWSSLSAFLSFSVSMAGLKGKLPFYCFLWPSGLNRDSNSEGYHCLPHFQGARAGVPWVPAFMVP